MAVTLHSLLDFQPFFHSPFISDCQSNPLDLSALVLPSHPRLMSSVHAARPRVMRAVAKSSVRSAELTRARKRREPTADADAAVVLSSSAPVPHSAAAFATVIASTASSAYRTTGERAVMASTVLAFDAARLADSSQSPLSPASHAAAVATTPAVVLFAPARFQAHKSEQGRKRSKTPVLASPWSAHSPASFYEWMHQHDVASPASSTSAASTASAASDTHLAPSPFMQRHSSLPCFPFPASSSPRSPFSGSSNSSASLQSLPQMPFEPCRLRSAPSAIRSVPSAHSPCEAAGSRTTPLSSGHRGATSGGANRFDSLQLRLAAHPAIQRLQQLEEARSDEPAIKEEEEENEDASDDEQAEQQSAHDLFHPVKEGSQLPCVSKITTSARASELSLHSTFSLPVATPAEHAPLAGLVTAFPFVQHFMPQPSRAEKKRQFIQRMHASHQLTIAPSTAHVATKLSALPQPFCLSAHPNKDELVSPLLPLALPALLRMSSSSTTLYSDDSLEELSSTHDSCGRANCSSSTLADDLANLSPRAQPLPLSMPATSTPFLLSPVLSSLLSSPAGLLDSCGGESALLCSDELQLGERAWSRDEQWMAEW